jgi:hypothetical protein
LFPITDWLPGMDKWQDIQSMVEVTRKRTFKKKVKEQTEQKMSY